MKIGFIGSGAMAVSIIKGLLDAGFSKTDIIVSSPSLASNTNKNEFLYEMKVESNVDVVNLADYIILSVKPHQLSGVITELSERINLTTHLDKCYVSIAAGVSIESISKMFTNIHQSNSLRIIRVMPNTPCSVRQGSSAFCSNYDNNLDKEIVRKIFSSVGIIHEVPEKLMEAVTGLSGSGPAYIFLLIEALADGGVRMGLPRAMALEMAAQTVKGAASLVLESGQHPAFLKDQVCSPGGTTIAAIESLEKNGFRYAAMSAVIASSNRATEIKEQSK